MVFRLFWLSTPLLAKYRCSYPTLLTRQSRRVATDVHAQQSTTFIKTVTYSLAKHRVPRALPQFENRYSRAEVVHLPPYGPDPAKRPWGRSGLAWPGSAQGIREHTDVKNCLFPLQYPPPQPSLFLSCA